MEREEAFLDLELQEVGVPLSYLDVTVRHGVPGHEARLKAAADFDGAVAAEADGGAPRGCTRGPHAAAPRPRALAGGPAPRCARTRVGRAGGAAQ